jgi:hypothetical protein
MLCEIVIKGTVSQDFLLLIFVMNQFPPSPRVFQSAPTVSTTPAAKSPLVAANLPPVSTTPVANNGNNYQTADNLK